ncbi:MAG: BtpA/SgcQ family protein [Phycisphaerae bacterium]
MTKVRTVKTLFSSPKAVVGMIHVGALPGTPRNSEPLAAIIARAREEAETYTQAGVDALIIENMHDVLYLKGSVGPEITAAMTAVGLAAREECSQVRGEIHVPAPKPGHKSVPTPLPLGVQILAAANREALAVALAIGAAFVRVENFAYAHVADEGLMSIAEAGPLLRYRRQIGAEHIKILADVKKKHSSHALTADVSLAEAAGTTEFFGAEAVVVTGTASGQPALPEDVGTVKNAVGIPVCIGSGLTPENLPDLWAYADVFIISSYFKRDGLWSNPIDGQRAAGFMAAAARLRKES